MQKPKLEIKALPTTTPEEDPHDHELIHKEINSSKEMKKLHDAIASLLRKKYKHWRFEVLVNLDASVPIIEGKNNVNSSIGTSSGQSEVLPGESGTKQSSDSQDSKTNDGGVEKE